MQGQGRTIDSCPESVDLDLGSVSNSTGMNQQTSWNNMFNPAENRLPNFMLSSDESNLTFRNAFDHDVPSFSGWGSGEPSSSANPQNQVISDGSKMEHAWSSSFSVRNGAGIRLELEERRFEPSNMLLCESGNAGSSVNVVTSEPSFLQNSSSDCLPQNLNQTEGYVGNRCRNGQDMEAGVSSNLGKSGVPETEQISPTTFSFGNVGSSSGISGFTLEENDGGSASLGSWGSSCKRKSLEGTSGSGQSYPGGSSSGFTQAEKSMWHTVSARHSASSSLSISTPPGSSRTASTTEQFNPRIGVGMGEAVDDFPPLSITGNSESSLRSFDWRVNSGHQQDPLPSNSSSRGSSRHFNFVGSFQIPSSRPLPYTESLEPRSAAANIGASQSQSNVMHGPGISRNGHPFPWNEASISRSRSSSSSVHLSGDRGISLREDASLASMTRNSAEHSMFSHGNETRSLAQDPTNWSLATGNISSPGDVPSTSRIGAGLSVHPLTPPWPSWIRHPDPQTLQRFSGFSPWTLFPSVDSEPAGQSANFPPLSSGTSASSQETMTSSGPSRHGHRQAHPTPAFYMERQSDDILGMPHSLRVLAADIEGRHRLISEIRQVLSAMRRGENLRVEDYMLFDPLIFHGLPEIHDRHRDMRLDVDNMSYEELLALGERIGDVKTGLNEETILKLMKQRKYKYFQTGSPNNMEPCCVCQEEYACGDDLGTLDCGHDFHTNCIKQWLMLKNLCPICKTSGLIT